MATLRVLCWPQMPATEALAEAARRAGVQVDVTVIASNEDLEARLGRAAFDVVFPSDYLVERLVERGGLLPLEAPADVVARIGAWARDAPHDPGCAWSLPFAFGTTGYLCRAEFGEATSWRDLLDPPPATTVGMLAEVREVIGAALIAAGRSPNDASTRALDDARALLLRQRPRVARYDSDDFVGPVLRGEVAAHQAWSGPAAVAVREHARLRYVVPLEGAGLWITTGAVAVGARDPGAARRLLWELAEPGLAASTTLAAGYATPNLAARALLPAALRCDDVLFPSDEVVARCSTFHDLGERERRLADVYREVVAAG